MFDARPRSGCSGVQSSIERAEGEDNRTVLDAPACALSCQEAVRRLVTGNARYVANAPRVRNFSASRVARHQMQALVHRPPNWAL